ncbi:MAG: pectate lyase [Verrucomicrobiaceae bacterium]|nr:pectate lyase [Verrucomicrobiaceae bacterium]
MNRIAGRGCAGHDESQKPKGMKLLVPMVIALSTGCAAIHPNIEKGIHNEFKEGGVIAFPGAEGAGKFTKGGRGGDVYHVTTLKDSGSGSLREGIESIKGPRTIIFDIGGTIRLKSDLKIINQSHLTIAGQSAPGKGITLADRALQIKHCHHVIVRYLRVRLGDENKPKGTAPDCITIDYNDHIILDHLSLSWGIDGNGDFRGLKHSTLQWLIFSEALHDSLHKKGKHAMCTSFRDNEGFATLHHNIYASSRNRHPTVSGGSQVLEFINNVNYNWSGGQNISGEQFNLLNNYYKAGPSLKAEHPLQFKSQEITPVSRGHFAGNYFDGLPEKYNLDNYTSMNYIASGKYKSTTRDFFAAKERFDAGKYKLTKIESAKEAYLSCLKKSGCSLMRDTVDERLIQSIINKTGKIIDSQKDVGGWDMYPTVTRQAGFDTDHDGMPDAWERKLGLNPNDPTDRNNDRNNDGFTNLEDYLNGLTHK